MKILVTGAGGQVAAELMKRVPAQVQAVALEKNELDITDQYSVETIFTREKPNVVINTAAYTKVDLAEQEQAAACTVNAEGVRNLARCCRQSGARMLQLSTDYVFAGQAFAPYLPEAATGPVSVYGASKHKGEKYAIEEAGELALIVRTSWVYSGSGSNFVLTMLKLMNSKEEISVVMDQVGTPTWAGSLALALWRFAGREDLHGIYHWTDTGVASWYDFSVAIYEEARLLGLIKNDVEIKPIRSQDFKTAAVRPAYGLLDKQKSWSDLGFMAPHWRVSLREMLKEVDALGTA